jgi:putative CocE/NonD family hydrolase
MQVASSPSGTIIERDVPITMRDGVLLRANIFRPEAPGKLPALIQRTPYGKIVEGVDDFARAGYVVVSQDTRGRYASDGEFKVFSEEDTGDGEDGYDTVEWAAAQPWCDGNIGTFGASYAAWTQYQLARLRPPHLKAMSAISIPAELTELDWPGAFRPGRRVKWWVTSMDPDLRRRAGLPPPHTSEEAKKLWEDGQRQSIHALLPWVNISQHLAPPLSDHVKGWLQNPDRRPWKFVEAHQNIEVPNLDFTGWFDHCTGINNFVSLQRTARTQNARKHTKMIIGPWNHSNLGLRKQGDFDFGLQAELNIQQTQIRWFDFWLKGIDNGITHEPAVKYFVMGSGEWKSAETWPPQARETMQVYLASNGDAHLPDGTGALVDKPPEQGKADAYTCDPLDPVPTLWSANEVYGVSDRRRLDHRADILRYCSAPLEHDLEVVGNPEVFLYAASSAVDTDFFARLVDDDPAGPAIEVCYGFLRARYRNGLDKELPLTPGEVAQFRIRLGIVACCFRKGHRIRLEVCSSDFPNHDRNHNTGKNDLLDAEMVIAKQKVFHSPQYPSSLFLPLQRDTRG